MSFELAQYLRDLAVRCCGLSRDTEDRILAEELETISTELIERAEAVESLLKVPNAPADDLNSGVAEIAVADNEDVG